MRSLVLVSSFGVSVALFASTASAQQAAFSDAQIQAPELAPPSRGSVAGQYAAVAFGPGDLTRGAFSLPAPVSLPSERGAIGASPVPSYSPDAAVSEWGAGWASPNLSIYRSRVVGSLDYATDDRTGPWGRMVRGTDGAWYPDGLATPVRVVETGADLVAYLPDGSQWVFGGVDSVVTPQGTYAWYLRQVTTVLGRVTTYVYTWNASGRPFLASVSYGGTNPSAPQYEITFDYQTLSPQLAISDYRSGTALVLDRRIAGVHALALDAGAFTERYRYAFTYVQDGGGPAFYLSSVQQTFASGQQAPAVTYTYGLSNAYFAQATPVHVAKLDSVLSAYGTNVFLPNHSTATDVDLDGRPDLELQYDDSILLQTDAGYERQPLPPVATGANPYCRRAPSTTNAPRVLARMRADVDDLDVVAMIGNGTATQTTVAVCDRAGNPLDQPVVLSGSWTLGSNARMVDLNHDNQPDLVRVFPGGYMSVPNTSSPQGISFGAIVQGALTPSVQADTTWVHDMNGDGIPDLISRYPGGLVAWMGKGNLEFAPQGQTFSVLTSTGAPLPNLKGYEIVFFDANNDGITDILLNNASSLLLFESNGNAFVSVAVPYFQSGIWASVQPIVLDVAGNGNTEVAYVRNNLAYALDLDAPGVGLLASADDGRGTVVSFTYQRALPDVGVRYRNSLLSQVQVSSVGYDPVAYTYTFGTPDLHSVGKFLLGYEEVTRAGALDTTTMRFSNTDDATGTLLSNVESDALTPAVERVTYRTYDEVTVRGVPWKRPATAGKGWQSLGAAAPNAQLDETTFVSYGNDVCAVTTSEATSAGTLTTTTALAAPAAFAGSLACIAGGITLSGVHADPSLNFQHQAVMDRNDQGQLTQLTLFDQAGDSLARQAVTYTPDALVATVTTPEHGTTSYSYVPGTPLLAAVATPDGVSSQALRDPLTDALDALGTNRGDLSYTETYTYDGRERLATRWNNLGQASAATPNARYTYDDATNTIPAYVETDTLVDAPTGTYGQGAEVLTASNALLAKAHRIPQGWALDVLTATSASERQTTAYTRPAIGGNLSALSVASLLSGAQPVKTSQSSLWGDVMSSSQSFHAGVERDVLSSLALAGGLTRTDVENGALATTTQMDESRRPLSDVDQAGDLSSYTRDVLGRVRVVTLADGTTRRLSIDDFGLPASIAHAGVGTVSYSYEPGTGLLAAKTFSSPDGSAQREVRYSYDGLGRTTVETDVDFTSNSTQLFTYLYDGATPSNPSGAGSAALGLATGVLGPSYSRAVTYRADGSVASTVVALAGQLTVTTSTAFYEDGSPRARTTTLTDGSGATLVTSTEATTRDAYGREAGTTIDGSPLATYAYDVNGLPLWATYASPVGNEQVVTLTHDPLTFALIGLNQNATTWAAASDLRLNARGLVDHEDFTVAGEAVTRQYTYAATPFLSSAADADATYSYAYDPTGLPTSITSVIGGVTDSRVFQQAPGEIAAGTHSELFDSLGRAITVDDLSLAYGANGQIATATRAGASWTYLYDERGQRVAKVVGGQIAAAYLPDGSTVDGAARSEPVRFAGTRVGVLKHPFGGGAKTFALVALDQRGTALSDAEGAPRQVSPFGDRVVHPDVAATVDYGGSRFDSDLGLVRMGARDYDAHLSRFTTPDPLVFENIGSCVGHAVDCTLYAYARNNPIMLVDPSGLWPGLWVGISAGDTSGIGGGDGVAVGGEVGILVDFGTPWPFHFFATGADGADAYGISAGAGISFGSIVDTSAFRGEGTTYSLSTPTPFGGEISTTPAGKFNAVGVTIGVGFGGSVSKTSTDTLVSGGPPAAPWAPSAVPAPSPVTALSAVTAPSAVTSPPAVTAPSAETAPAAGTAPAASQDPLDAGTPGTGEDEGNE